MAATYRLQFTDRLDVNWKVDFLIDGGGTVSTMSGSGNPLTIEYMSSSEELFDGPIKGSVADISVISTSLFQWIGLYAEGDLDTKVNIYYDDSGDVLFWSGYILSGAYSQPYSGGKYSITINAGDGLGYLKKINFDDDGTPYTGRKTDAWIIWTILSKINATSFSEYINIYEDTMDATATDSPLDQVETDVALFEDDDCYDTLEEVLKKYNACIRQVNGIFVIYRPLELYNATTDGRTYTSATVHGAASQLTPNVLFSRVGAPTDIIQINGGDLNIQQAAEELVTVQDYGKKESWISNYDFSINNYDYDTSTFNDWTSEGSAVQAPIQDFIPDESDGIVINSHQNPDDYSNYAEQIFGNNLVAAATDETFISFEWQWINQDDTSYKGPEFKLAVFEPISDKWLTDSGDGVNAHWATLIPGGQVHIEITDDVPAGNSGWKTYTRNITGGLPEDGPLTARILANTGATTTYLTVFMAIKNLKIYSTSNEVKRISRSILITINDNVLYINRKPIYETTVVKEVTENRTTYVLGVKGLDIEYVYRVGDIDPSVTNITNTIEQFAGCLTTDGVETTAWSTIIPGGESDELLVLIAGEISIQYARPRQILSVPVYEGHTISDNPQIKLLGSFQDSLNQYGAVNRRFVFDSGSFDVRNRQWDLDLIEIISTIP